MGHSVGKAAENAVQRGAYKKEVERTPEQILKDIRRNLDARLAVTPDDVRFLLAQYDKLLEKFRDQLAQEIVDVVVTEIVAG